MAKFKLLTPANLILLGLSILTLATLGSNRTLFAVNLIDPNTSKTFTCSSTFECYTKVASQINTQGPALACIDGKCAIQNCNEGEETTSTCPDGKKIVLRNCINGKWESRNNFCVVECTGDSTCLSTYDNDCDGKPNPIQGNCVSSKCVFPTMTSCSKEELIWNQWRWQIIAGAMLFIGVGGFIFKEQILKVF